jgi:predicted oxidoreductase
MVWSIICLENKITTFDHADIYGFYTTEADFGKASTCSTRKNTIDFQMSFKC